MTPTFSVLIPTRNRPGRLARALESVMAQTWPALEVLVIDDGSDDTLERLRDYANVTYLRGPGRGVAAARNRGIASSKGTHVAFLDDDDFWYPHKLATVAAALAKHPDTGIVYSKIDYIDENGRWLWTTRQSEIDPRRAYLAILVTDFIGTSAAVVNRSVLDNVGGFDESLPGCEDWELWIRVVRRHSILLVPEALVAYENQSSGSLTSQYRDWLSAHDAAIAKALAEDTTLSVSERRRIEASGACTKGRISLGAGDDRAARAYFARALALDRRQWRAAVYASILALPRLRAILPVVLKRALRLPELHG